MALWERSDALARLEAMHRDTTRAGRVALVAGEAGIGKSTLIRAFADRCGARARVLVGLCDPLLTLRASGPLQDIARQAGGVLGDRVDARASQSELFGALIQELSGPAPRHRVAWHTDPRNVRSRAVAQRLGLAFEGVRRSSHVVAGVRQDVEVWSIIADEWPPLVASDAELVAAGRGN